jgi:hypothetical protein
MLRMAKEGTFSRVDPELLPVLEELQRREPIFHTKEFGTTFEEFERAVAPDYWEVGATGRRYSRAFILQTFQAIPPIAAADEWQCRDFGLLQLGPDTYLLTYTLNQWDRLTRRATVWQRTADGWRILYHQGTAVSHDEDDMVPVGETSANGSEEIAELPASEEELPEGDVISAEPESD